MKGRTAYEIVLDRLISAEEEKERNRGERDIAQSALRDAQIMIRELREVSDLTTSDSTRLLLIDSLRIMEDSTNPEHIPIMQRLQSRIADLTPPPSK